MNVIHPKKVMAVFNAPISKISKKQVIRDPSENRGERYRLYLSNVHL